MLFELKHPVFSRHQLSVITSLVLGLLNDKWYKLLLKQKQIIMAQITTVALTIKANIGLRQ